MCLHFSVEPTINAGSGDRVTNPPSSGVVVEGTGVSVSGDTTSGPVNAPVGVAPGTSSEDVNTKAKSSGIKGKAIKRKLINQEDEEIPIIPTDPVSYLGYLFQKVPSKIQFEDLRKRVMIAKLEAA